MRKPAYAQLSLFSTKLRNLRNKLTAHASRETAQKLRTEAFAKHGNCCDHYKNLVAKCNKTIQTLTDAFLRFMDEA